MVRYSDYKDILSLLPHQPPFRFIDQIIEYSPTKYLVSSLHPENIKKIVKGNNHIPPSIFIEGLAQTAVLFTQLETKPLHKKEVPLLGSISFTQYNSINWNDIIYFKVKIIRIISKQAVIGGEVYTDTNRIARTSLSLAITQV